ncbi:Protein of unknown function DUF2181 [Trypanosoma melophagium]|uniref:Protein of unknown function DUF2181 n=1 Tax=Trypanosoma melophagium TaxID=715481 RepID=UPI00351A4DE5|nr:Protein of unknown function DUF2181 [Trypanosoma melophagium]
MFDGSSVANRETPEKWLHAANSLTALHAVKTHLTHNTESQQEEVLGIEVDVRVLPNREIPVLRHDPFPVDNAIPIMDSVVKLTEWLETLAEIVQQTQRRRIGVVKFDFKDPTAAVLTYELFTKSNEWYKTLCRCFSFWWNADVVMAANSAVLPVSKNGLSFLSLPQIELHKMIYTVVDKLGFGLSFGWVLPDGFRMYDVNDIYNMRVFLQRLAAFEEKWHFRPSCITFAVRYSAVFGEEDKCISGNSSNNNIKNKNEVYTSLWETFDELLREASCLFTVDNEVPPCFLTFWRARSEIIKDKDIAMAKSRFPTCTIDVD